MFVSFGWLLYFFPIHGPQCALLNLLRTGRVVHKAQQSSLGFGAWGSESIALSENFLEMLYRSADSAYARLVCQGRSHKTKTFLLINGPTGMATSPPPLVIQPTKNRKCPCTTKKPANSTRYLIDMDTAAGRFQLMVQG